MDRASASGAEGRKFDSCRGHLIKHEMLGLNMNSQSSADYAQLLTDFLKAYESKDIAAISEMFSSDVLLRDWNLEVTGKVEALREFEKNFAAAQSLKIAIKNVYVSESGAAAELEILVNQTESLRVVDVVTFDTSNIITSVVSYKGL